MTERAFLEGLTATTPAAFILGYGTAHTLGFVRSLGRRGIPVAAISGGPRVWSRYCRLERALETEAAQLDFLERVGSRLPAKGVLIPTGDGDVLFVVRNRARLDRYFHCVAADADITERLANKRYQYESAAAAGVPVPETHCPTSPDDLARIARSIDYPCIVKPAYSHLWADYRRQVPMRAWHKLAQADTPDELRAAYERMRESGVELLVQERIEGAEARLYAVYVYLDRASDPLASLVMQKQRQSPPMYGNGSYSVSCRHDGAVALSVKLLKSLGYTGIANVEFKEDPRDGQLKLIEVNVRCGNRVALAIDAGVDIPYIAYRDALGRPTAAVDTYEVGVAWIDLLRDAAGFPHYRRTEGLRLSDWARSAWNARSHPFFATDDPLPFFANVRRTAASVLTAYRS